MKNILQANDSITSNSKQLETLKTHFPQCFDKNGAFIPHKLQEIVEGSGVALSKEGYTLNWLGKSYARLLANENVRTLLKANTAHNELPENRDSQNLLIKGDNLEVLKHLVGAYSEQVKMIYIDPPYNTGSDGFVYQDDRKFTTEQLSHLAGISEDEAKRILEFTDSKSNSHSAWLTFMYPRLYIAKQLLREDGVIFISIDDNEQAQLKLLCDEVFGEENFEGHIHWRRRHNQPNDKTKMIGLVAEHIIAYALNKEAFKHAGVGKVDLTGSFSNSDLDSRGDWASKPWKTGSDQNGSIYEVKSPSGKIFKEEWMGDEQTFLNLLRDNRIIWPKNGDGFPRKKYFRFERELEGQCATNWWGHEEFGHNQAANDVITELFTGVKNVFSNPKPPTLIRGLLQIGNVKSRDLTLDFFAGSGTTAHAVMQLNAEDGGNRQFICVQIDEPTDPKSEARKAGYQTIYEITSERIQRAAAKIRAENPLFHGDLGFKQFETIPVFEGYLDEIEELTPTTELFNASTLTTEQLHDLMLTWQVMDRIPLSQSLVPLDLGGYTAYADKREGGKILYFMEAGLTLDHVITLLEKLDTDPTFTANHWVAFGYVLDSKAQREISEAVHYRDRKGTEITWDVRF